MAKTIQNLADEYIRTCYDSYLRNTERADVSKIDFKAGAKTILKEIEFLIKDTSGDGDAYHYNLYMNLLNLVKQLKVE